MSIDLNSENEEGFDFLDEDTVGQLYGRLSDHRTALLQMPYLFSKEIMEAVKAAVDIKLGELAQEMEEEERLVWDSQSMQQYKVTIDFLKARVNRIEQQLQNKEGIATILQVDKDRIVQEIEQQETAFMNRELSAIPSLLDISFLQVSQDTF